MKHVLRTANFKLFWILALIYGLLTIDFGLIYAQEKLEVTGDTEIESTSEGTTQFRHGLILNPLSLTAVPPTAPPSPATAGQLYYNANYNILYYHDGTDWKGFSGGDKTVATRIVAAWNSLDSVLDSDRQTDCPGDGTACYNPRADKTCNGTADQVEINDAINELGANGGAVYLLEGTYNLSGSIVLNNDATNDSNKSIIGTGAGTVLTMATPDIHPINASSVTGILISNLSINGNAIGNGAATYAINFSTVTGSKIKNLWIQNMGTNGGGIHLASASNNNSIVNTFIIITGQTGILIDNSSNNVITNTNIRDSGLSTGSGVYNICLDNGANNNVISGNYLSTANENAIMVGLALACYNNVISANQVIDSKADGIYIDNGSSYNSINANNIYSSGQHGIQIEESTYNTISNNIFRANTEHGILLSSGSSNNSISGNVFLNNGGSDAFDGIHILSSGNIISSNRISDDAGTAGYGINISNTSADSNYLAGNLILGAGYIDPNIPPTYDRRINDSGTGTKYTSKEKITLEKFTSTVSSSTTLSVTTSPKSYYVITVTGADRTLNTVTPISAGKEKGDMLILQVDRTSPFNLIINNADAARNVRLGASPRTIRKADVLGLVWDRTSTTCCWVEAFYSDNNP